ncbi:hypothetical protein EYF80_010549 [Liparis tanakae]|uniref:Uncharacterized protein n=1 Tax=Liparis tanakae TaxID=230148 RepID=A0A4Z2IPC1_9TELE|nr:hypothetical protein EYF80_010549 [Liparis tanakae]
MKYYMANEADNSARKRCWRRTLLQSADVLNIHLWDGRSGCEVSLLVFLRGGTLYEEKSAAMRLLYPLMLILRFASVQMEAEVCSPPPLLIPPVVTAVSVRYERSQLGVVPCVTLNWRTTAQCTVGHAVITSENGISEEFKGALTFELRIRSVFQRQEVASEGSDATGQAMWEGPAAAACTVDTEKKGVRHPLEPSEPSMLTAKTPDFDRKRSFLPRRSPESPVHRDLDRLRSSFD